MELKTPEPEPKESPSLVQSFFPSLTREAPEAPVGFSKVFSAELGVLAERRRAQMQDDSLLRDAHEPSTQLGLIGVGLSGGGIRSATFSLGVLQGLGSTFLKKVDYLSTVSGGGFVGATLSTALNAGSAAANSPFRKREGADSAIVKYLRNRSSYLSTGGPIDLVRLPAMVVRGLLLNLVALLPWLLLAVLLTEVAFTAIYNVDAFDLVRELPLALGLPFFVLLFISPLVPRLERFGFNSNGRYESLFAGALLLGVAGVVGHFAWRYVIYAIDHHADAERWVGSAFWAWSVAFSIVAVAQVRFHAKLRRTARRLLWVVLGSFVPIALVGSYLLLCTRIIAVSAVPLDEHISSLPLGPDAPAVKDPGAIFAWLEGYEFRPQVGSLRLSSSGSCSGGAAASAANADRKSLEACLIRACSSLSPACDHWSWTFTDSASHEEHRLVPWRDEETLFAGPESDRLYLVLNELPWNTLAVFNLKELWVETFGTREVHHARGATWHEAAWMVFIGLALLGVFGYLFSLDANAASLHGFYRDALARAFVVAPHGETVEPVACLRLSQLEPGKTGAPYPLLNATLNVRGATESALRNRKGTAFVLSPEFVGSERTGYVATKATESVDTRLTLASAVAISAAAAGPSMGAYSSGWLAPLFVLLNLRLGYWLPHPKFVAKRFRLATRPGPRHVLREALGLVGDQGNFVNVSDGGHFENLGGYELVRRKCRLIVLVDGEQDPSGQLAGLTTLMRLVRIDFGATITADVASFRGQREGHDKKQWLWAKIRYEDGEEGDLLYLKATMAGDELEYVHAYRLQAPQFPHESTADQFFNEIQFECYRALGEHVGEAVRRDKSLEACVTEVMAATSAASSRVTREAPRPDLQGLG
jgi:hypothetical protein